MKIYTAREFEGILRHNGYVRERVNGSHASYKNENGDLVTVPIVKLNPCIAGRLIKEHDLKEVIQ